MHHRIDHSQSQASPDSVQSDEQVKTIRRRLGNRNLVLVGLMGAGKSAIGRRLGRRLDLPFTDADREIELAAGKSIADIFADHGEPYFRDGERRVIARLLGNGPQVLATGGGAFIDEEIRKAIAARGISIWLKADLEILMERVMRRNTRPLLKQGNPRKIMEELIKKRYPVYARADITVQSRNEPHEVIINEIIDKLSAQMLPQGER